MARDTKRPEKPYLVSSEMDALARFNTELLSELSILRDRVLVLEHLLSEHGVLDPDAVDHHQPSEVLNAKLIQDRDALVARVVGAPHRDELSVENIKKRR
ncbi:MAG: hypothetical protein AAGJ86_09615 [Pseudomonadota bacterium]